MTTPLDPTLIDEIIQQHRFDVEKLPPAEAFANARTALINRDYIAKEDVLSAIGEDDNNLMDTLSGKAKTMRIRNALRASIKTKLGLEK
jgi:hypothetical protein